jgi:AcrR family transcriptional regulator
VTNLLATTPCKRERTHATIIAAARQIIAEKDIDAASIDELMQAAGMARGTFYNHFTSRETLLLAVLADIQRCLRETVENRIPTGLPAESVVACMIYGFLQFGLDHPDTGRALVRIAASQDWLTRRDASTQVFPRADSAFQSLLGDIPFSSGLAYLEGVVNQLLRHRLSGQIDTVETDQVIALSLRGLGISAARVQRAQAAAKAFCEQQAIHHAHQQPGLY